jgi:hypothetical protein
MKKSFFCRLTVCFLVTFALATTPCLANGKGGHDHGHGMNAHMQAMYALKDSGNVLFVMESKGKGMARPQRA